MTLTPIRRVIFNIVKLNNTDLLRFTEFSKMFITLSNRQLEPLFFC